MEEEDKDFAEFRVPGSKTFLALLDAKKAGVPSSQGYIPTLEVSDLDKFVETMRQRGVRFGSKFLEGEHVRLIDFYDPSGNLFQAFEFKHKKK